MTRTAIAAALADSDTARRLIEQLDRTAARHGGARRGCKCRDLAAWLDRWAA